MVFSISQQGALLFLDHTLGLHHLGDLRLDLDDRRWRRIWRQIGRLRMLLLVLDAFLDHFLFALDHGYVALATVFAVFHAGADPVDAHLDDFTDPLGHRHPRHVEEQAETGAEQQQQQQRRAGKAQPHVGAMADQFTQHAARHARQLHLHGVQAQEFQTHRTDQHQAEADHADDAFLLVYRIFFLLQHELAGQAAIALPHYAQHVDTPPPG